MKLDAYASFPHYFDHLAPIWSALDPDVRGTFYIPGRLEQTAADYGIPVSQNRLPRSENPTLVAAFSDLRYCKQRPIVLVEHGSGQQYQNVTDGSYSGGVGRDRVILFICPNDTVAEANLATYPSSTATVVGCPKLDDLLAIPHPQNPTPVIAVSFHWDCAIAPETRSAFPYFHAALRPLASRYTAIGHGHPRGFSRLRRFYHAAGIEVVSDFAEVVRRADVLCIDNSSAGFEWLALDRPLVWLSPPWYRREVHHGLRFWEAIEAGEHVTDPADWPDAIDSALDPTPDRIRHRREWASRVYTYLDGNSAARAARAIERVLTEGW